MPVEGEIKVGDEFIWAPGKLHAVHAVRVTAIENGRIMTTAISADAWNDEDRFREACVRRPKLCDL